MKIANIEAIPLRLPFIYGGESAPSGGHGWSALDVVIVRVETDTGITGFGEAFSYSCRRAVKAAVEDMVAPLAVGSDASDIAGLLHRLQKALHLFGRYGITTFALSGLDIALWDIAGKEAGLPLRRLLGGSARSDIPAYASLLKYGDAELVARYTAEAVGAGYRHVKIHETEEREVRAAREAAGDDIPLMVDTNCPWTPAQARENALRLKPYDLYWLEEPIFPPEDFAALARLQAETGIALAAGENACTAFQFQAMLDAGAVTYAQPSVTKVGGVTEFRKVAALAETQGTALMAHSPYFGPGFLATMQLIAALPEGGLCERFYLKLEASLFGDLVNPVDGRLRLPDAPGLGADPDPDVIRDYRAREG